jgi:hypothetical protein
MAANIFDRGKDALIIRDLDGNVLNVIEEDSPYIPN